jgi:hypothetical protein
MIHFIYHYIYMIPLVMFYHTPSMQLFALLILTIAIIVVMLVMQPFERPIDRNVTLLFAIGLSTQLAYILVKEIFPNHISETMHRMLTYLWIIIMLTSWLTQVIMFLEATHFILAPIGNYLKLRLVALI